MILSFVNSLALALCLCSVLVAVSNVDAACDAVNCMANLSGSKKIKNKNFKGRAKECIEKVSATVADSYVVHDYSPGVDINGDHVSMMLVDVKGLRQTVYGTIFPYKGITCYVDCQLKCPDTGNEAAVKRFQQMRSIDPSDKFVIKRKVEGATADEVSGEE